jgi:hypothetical protein
MFGFSSQRSRKAKEVGLLFRRLLNNTVPRVPLEAEELRQASRSPRSIPIFVAPWHQGTPVTGQVTFGTTKEISDHGLAIVLPIQPYYKELVMGMLVEREPRFLRGLVKHCSPMGGGYWQLGIQIAEILEPAANGLRELLPFADHLSPTMESNLKQMLTCI